MKPVVIDDMREAIETVANGHAYVPSFIQPRPEIAPLARGPEHASSADER